MDALKKKLQNVQSENTKLKSQIKSGDNNNNKQSSSSTPIKEFKPDPLEKYNKMKDLGMSIDGIVNKMTKAGIDNKEIEKWKQKQTSQSADKLLASKVNAKELQYAKYDKMRKFGMNDDTIRNKMKMDGLKSDEIERYLNGGNTKTNNNNNNNQQQDEFKKKMAKYEKMKKMHMPEHAIRNKMRLDGISQADQDKFFNPNADDNNNNKKDEKKANPALAKYEKMKKMGMPTHAIVNKMRLDGISAEDIAEFENPGSTSTKKKKEKTTDPRLAKYFRMTRMGMPTHAIINKMRYEIMFSFFLYIYIFIYSICLHIFILYQHLIFLV